MPRTSFLHWVDRRRARRVAQLIAALWALSLCDLLFTLWAWRFTPFHEANPIARALLEQGLVTSLVLMKLVLTAVGATIFWRLRGRARAELALWSMVAVYVALALRWSHYTSGIMLLAAGN